jgi:ABC-2 type transport system ATP-binding protein
MNTVIEMRDATNLFRKHDVLKGVDLRIEAGSVVGLLGANGAGKSTLIKCLLGLQRVDSGECQLFGEDSWDLPASVKARLGYVPQQVSLHPWMKAWQVAEYIGAFYETWDRELVDSMFDRWKLRREASVGTLSGGELQKLGFIVAIGHRPDLLILDEPAAAMDPAARREFLRTILDPVSEQQTVLFSTHIMSDLEQVATHVAFLHEGRIILWNRLDELQDRMKRVRLTASDDLPSSFSHPGALRTQVSGREAVLALADADEPVLEELRTRWRADVSVEALNLEDIFLELHDATAV